MKKRTLSKDGYILEIEQYIDDMGFKRNMCRIGKTKDNGDIIYRHVVLPILVENYSKDSEISFVTDLDRYNIEEILEDNRF